jgi:hypothetical protein
MQATSDSDGENPFTGVEFAAEEVTHTRNNAMDRSHHLDAMLMLGAAMGGENIDRVVESVGRSNQGRQNVQQTLPVKMRKKTDRIVLEEWGFVFGEMEPDDRLFIRVTFPEGWKKQSTDHYMWNKLVDPKGKARGSYFYKPDFWDRDAFFDLNHRFHVGKVYFQGDRENWRSFQGQVTDWDEKVLFTGTRFEHPNPTHCDSTDAEERSAYWKMSDELEKKARQEATNWIEARCPDHTNVRLYWDLEAIPDPLPVKEVVIPPEPPTQVAEAEEPTKIEPNPKAKAKRKKKGTAK